MELPTLAAAACLGCFFFPPFLLLTSQNVEEKEQSLEMRVSDLHQVLSGVLVVSPSPQFFAYGC